MSRLKNRFFLVIFCLGIAAILGLNFSTASKTIPLTNKSPITRILVEKEARKLHVFAGDTLLKTYEIALGFFPEGHKEVEGDGKTPEGIYKIESKNPNSAYFLNLGVSYPNEADRAHAARLGKSPGGDIKIHGLPNGSGAIGKAHLLRDWTQGCIALTNPEMQELYDSVPIGTEIEIVK